MNLMTTGWNSFYKANKINVKFSGMASCKIAMLKTGITLFFNFEVKNMKFELSCIQK